MISDLEEAIEMAKEKAKKRGKEVLVYEDEGSGVENDFVVTLSEWGPPREFPEIGKTYKIFAEIFPDGGNVRVALAPSVRGEVGKNDQKDQELYEGREVAIVFNDRVELSEITELSERQIKTESGHKFKRSDLESGWGTEESYLDLNVESYKRDIVPEFDLENIDESKLIVTSKLEVYDVVEITERQIKTTGDNFRKSDGKIWGGDDKSIIKVIE